MPQTTLVAALILALNTLVAAAETAVICTAGCERATACEGDSSPNLLCLNDRAAAISA